MSQFFECPPEANEHFPAHGWMANVDGARVLRLPVLRLFQHGEPGHRYFLENKLGGVWLQSRSPERTLRQLSVCFRDLHHELREILPLTIKKDKTSHELTRWLEGIERTEVLLIAAFHLLRRLPDDLVDASRPCLFEHWQSAPRQLKSAVSAANDNKLQMHKPRCDLGILSDALLNHTAWFDRLRNTDGVRDVLTHKPHILQIGAQGSQDPDGAPVNWRMTATLTQGLPGKDWRHMDLFPLLLECIDGACDFMKLFCQSVGLGGCYQRGDCLFLTGSDNDSVGFWPPIFGQREGFPIMD